MFSLTGTSPRVPRSELPEPGDNFAVIDMRSIGVRHLPAAVYGADYLEFAISTFGRRVHPNYPAEFDIYIDSNNDGVDDFVVFNAENGGFSATGQNLVFSRTWRPGSGAAVFYTDADLNSGNAIFTVPMNSTAGSVNVGVQPGTTFGFSVYAFDNYFTGSSDGSVGGHVVHAGQCALLSGRRSVRDGRAPRRATVPVATADVPDRGQHGDRAFC